MSSSRTLKSTKNLGFALTGQIVNTLLTFFTRGIFVRFLSQEYLGLNGLFSNILTILSLAELGVGSAITFSLYKPLAEEDHELVASIMQLYKRIYTCIGIFVLALGLSISPIIDYLITADKKINNIELYFALYVINTGISYFFSYKKTIISADQRQYIITIYQYISLIIQNVLQIISLITVNSFALFLIIQIVCTAFQNILLSRKAEKLYPYIKYTNKKVPNSVLTTIRKNISAMFIHKVGSAVVNSTDNIIISKMINIVATGIYSNYALIIGALNQIIGQFFGSITSSVGNLNAVSDAEKVETVFYRVLFINCWIYSFSSSCLYSLIQPFIYLWIGEKYLLTNSVLLVIVLNFYIAGIRKPVITFRDAIGLYWYDRYNPIFESLINLITSLILVRSMGIVGVFLGTTMSTVTTSLWVEPFVLYKYGFKKNGAKMTKEYFGRLFWYSFCTCTSIFCSSFLSNLINDFGYLSFVLKCIITAASSIFVFVTLNLRNKQLKWLFEVLIMLIRKAYKGNL